MCAARAHFLEGGGDRVVAKPGCELGHFRSEASDTSLGGFFTELSSGEFNGFLKNFARDTGMSSATFNKKPHNQRR